MQLHQICVRTQKAWNATYARLAAGRNNLLPSGKKTQYVPLAQIPEIQAAIDRGKEITQLTKRLHQLDGTAAAAKAERAAAMAALESGARRRRKKSVTV